MTVADDVPIGDDELPELFAPFEGRRLALAVSGGVDSVVLMHLVARWLRLEASARWREFASDQSPLWEDEAGFQAEVGIGMPQRPPRLSASAGWVGTEPDRARLAELRAQAPVVVLSVDHRLRSGSADEAAAVARVAAALGLAHQTLVWHRAEQAPGAGMPALQEQARDARYALMADCLEAEVWAYREAGDVEAEPASASSGKRTIVTAHHQDDLVETFLMRLKRGSGLDGLGSIRTLEHWVRRPEPGRPYPSAVDLCRPLLDVPKSRLVATAQALKLSWNEDPSNADQRFERVRQRHDGAALSKLGFEPKALHRAVRRLQRANDAVDLAVAAALRGELGDGYSVDLHGGLYASVSLPPAWEPDRDRVSSGDGGGEIALRIVAAVLAAFGGEQRVSLAQIETLLAEIPRDPGQSGEDMAPVNQRTLAGCRIDCRHGVGDGPPPQIEIRVWREPGRAGLPTLELGPGDGAWWDDRFAISVSEQAPDPIVVRALGDKGWAEARRRAPALQAWRQLPPGAAATLPGIWKGEVLAAVPYFSEVPEMSGDASPGTVTFPADWRRGGHAIRRLYRAEFRPVFAGGYAFGLGRGGRWAR